MKVAKKVCQKVLNIYFVVVAFSEPHWPKHATLDSCKWSTFYLREVLK